MVNGGTAGDYIGMRSKTENATELSAFERILTRMVSSFTYLYVFFFTLTLSVVASIYWIHGPASFGILILALGIFFFPVCLHLVIKETRRIKCRGRLIFVEILSLVFQLIAGIFLIGFGIRLLFVHVGDRLL